MKLVNRTYEELSVGDNAELRRLVTLDDLYVFAAASGNYNPLHLPTEDGDGDGRAESVAPGMFAASMISAVLGTLLPGPGTSYRTQTLAFGDRAFAGDELRCLVTVTEKLNDGGLRLRTEVLRDADGATVLDGTAEVTAPQKRFSKDDIDVPGLVVQRHRHFEDILERARPLPPIRTAVVCPEEVNSLGGAILAARESILTPILVGDPSKIAAAAGELGEDLHGIEIVGVAQNREAARTACRLVNEGHAAAVMKGHLHTDDLLRPMLDKSEGLRMGRRFTHVFVMDVPGLPHPLLVSDAAINIAPDLKAKIDIVQNAIDLAVSIGHGTPRVAVLSAVETVNPEIQSSMDAALLSKMADRGQIIGGTVEGPLAMDNAVDLNAARTKGLKGDVAGHANVLVVPGIDAGNMVAKQLSFISHAEGAGLVLGAKVPVILNSRSDSVMSRLASCAVAAIHHARQTNPIQ